MAEFIRILLVFLGTLVFSTYIHLAISLWQLLPIKEERSTPLYITKEIRNGR